MAAGGLWSSASAGSGRKSQASIPERCGAGWWGWAWSGLTPILGYSALPLWGRRVAAALVGWGLSLPWHGALARGQLCSLEHPDWCTCACPWARFHLTIVAWRSCGRKMLFSTAVSYFLMKTWAELETSWTNLLDWSCRAVLVDPPCCAIENEAEQEEGFVKMTKDQVSRHACTCACLCTLKKRKRGNNEAANFLIMNG